MTVMIDDSPKTNTGKRRFSSLDLACTAGTKRGKVFSYYPSVANHCIQSDQLYEYRTIIPTADDYANLVFCSSDDEEDEALFDEPCAKRRRNDKRRRRVSFGAFIPVIHELDDTPLASEMTSDEKTNLWLNPKEIEAIKVSANSTIQDMRNLVVESHTSETRTTFRALMSKLEEDKNTSIRGLEHRVFRRKVSRQVLVEEVLECQKHIQGLSKFGHAISHEEQIMLLANVSSKRSASASNLALLNAKNDSLEGDEDGAVAL
jgi:hypothetical protein